MWNILRKTLDCVVHIRHNEPTEAKQRTDKIMKTKAYKEPKELADARAAVRSLTFGTDEWESAMEIVRKLVQAETDADQALLNHRCVYDRDWLCLLLFITLEMASPTWKVSVVLILLVHVEMLILSLVKRA